MSGFENIRAEISLRGILDVSKQTLEHGCISRYARDDVNKLHQPFVSVKKNSVSVIEGKTTVCQGRVFNGARGGIETRTLQNDGSSRRKFNL